MQSVARASALLFLLLVPVAGQEQGTLQISVVLGGADAPSPVAKHALLISDNPATAAPRRVITSADGTVSLRLPAGSYIVESDTPALFQGRGHTWTQLVEVAAGASVTVNLTLQNAEIGDAPEVRARGGSLEEVRLLERWGSSVVGVWTPRARATGVLVDRRGLILTSRRPLGDVGSATVQLSPALKVAAQVLEQDSIRDVVILRVDPAVTSSISPVALNCAAPAAAFKNGQNVFGIGVPLTGTSDITPGGLTRVEGRLIEADLRVGPSELGGPVFTATDDLVGVTSLLDDPDSGYVGDQRIVPVSDACRVRDAALAKLDGALPPATPLPVEPVEPFPTTRLRLVEKQRAGSLSGYQMSSPDFDIRFITPVLAHIARQQLPDGRSRSATPEAMLQLRFLTDFGSWSEYVAGGPDVLMIRVTPRFAEGFWATLARGAAYTQGVALPPIKRFRPGFVRLQAFCGTTEITPIQPFVLETRVSDTDAIREGLYVFDKDALGPSCASVRLLLFSEKTGEKGDTRVVDAQLLEQVRRDFAP